MRAIILCFCLLGCANVRELTNINASQSNSMRPDSQYWASIDQKVQFKSLEETTSCVFVEPLLGKDSIFQYGKKVAELRLKELASQAGADSVVITKEEKRGENGHNIFGKAFRCRKD